MDHSYWEGEWRAGRLPWHGTAVHRDLVDFGPNFLQGGAHRILVPLCGKTLDLAWLAARGHDVYGIEFVSEAITTVFEEAGLEPVEEQVGPYRSWRSGTLTLIQADFFEMDSTVLGPMDRLWDRGGLVNVDPGRRAAYVQRLRSFARAGAQAMVNVFSYDQTGFDGPPFSVPDTDFKALFASMRGIKLLRRDKTRVRQPLALQHIEGTGTETWLVEM